MLGASDGYGNQQNITQVPQQQGGQQFAQPWTQMPRASQPAQPNNGGQPQWTQEWQPQQPQQPQQWQDNGNSEDKNVWSNQQASQDQQNGSWDQSDKDKQDGDRATLEDIDKEAEDAIKKEKEEWKWDDDDKENDKEKEKEKWDEDDDDYLEKVMQSLLKENTEKEYELKKASKKSEILWEKYESLLNELNELKYDPSRVKMKEEMMPWVKYYENYKNNSEDEKAKYNWAKRLYEQLGMLNWRDMTNEVQSFYSDMKNKLSNISKQSQTSWATWTQKVPQQQPKRGVWTWVLRDQGGRRF